MRLGPRAASPSCSALFPSSVPPDAILTPGSSCTLPPALALRRVGTGWGGRRGRRSPRRSHGVTKVPPEAPAGAGPAHTPLPHGAAARPTQTLHALPQHGTRPGQFTTRRPAAPSLGVTLSRSASPVSMGTGGARWAAVPARRHVRGRDGARHRCGVVVEERPGRALRGGERPRTAPALASLGAFYTVGAVRAAVACAFPPPAPAEGAAGPRLVPSGPVGEPPAGPAASARPGTETFPAGSLHPCRCPGQSRR